jgi:hypothetical protein
MYTRWGPGGGRVESIYVSRVKGGRREGEVRDEGNKRGTAHVEENVAHCGDKSWCGWGWRALTVAAH